MSNVVREADGKFVVPPRSPGRPRGPSAAERVQAYIEPHMQAVLDKALELAKLGDPASMKLLMERYSPAPKPDAERVVVEGFANAPTLELKAMAVMSAVASGAITAEAGEKLLRTLDAFSRVVIADQHEQRLRALEAGAGRTSRPVTVPAIEAQRSGAPDNVDDLV